MVRPREGPLPLSSSWVQVWGQKAGRVLQETSTDMALSTLEIMAQALYRV